jgi:hypothetical protein
LRLFIGACLQAPRPPKPNPKWEEGCGIQSMLRQRLTKTKKKEKKRKEKKKTKKYDKHSLWRGTMSHVSLLFAASTARLHSEQCTESCEARKKFFKIVMPNAHPVWITLWLRPSPHQNYHKPFGWRSGQYSARVGHLGVVFVIWTCGPRCISKRPRKEYEVQIHIVGPVSY